MGNANGRDTIYREITDKIIKDFEGGIVPWVKPWSSGSGLSLLSLPQNALTRRSYSGINILLLWSALEEKGFASNHWVTFKQCIAMGGSVRKGERGTHVYFADSSCRQKRRPAPNRTAMKPPQLPFSNAM